jgi:hypothetical protein
MTDLRQAAKAVVDRWDTLSWSWSEKTPTAILMAALRAALEQQAEPTPWRDMVVVSLVREGINKHRARELADHFAAQPEPVAKLLQEPVAWIQPGLRDWLCVSYEKDDVHTVPVYPHPPAEQRPWQGLTDDEMTEIVTDIDVDWGDLLWKVVCLTKIIEAKLKERNT